MYQEPILPTTPTNSGHEDKGTILGLEGMAVVPVLGAAVVSILLVVVLVMGATGSALFPRVLVALSPVGLTTAYVLVFVHRKPPNYQKDALELWRGRVPVLGPLLFPNGVAFNAAPLPPQREHPFARWTARQTKLRD